MTKFPNNRVLLKEARARSLVETSNVPTRPNSKLSTRIGEIFSLSIRAPRIVIRIGIVNDKMAAFEAEECAMPHESITDGGTIPKTPSSKYSRRVFQSKPLRIHLRFCFSRNQSGISRTAANSNVQKFNA